MELTDCVLERQGWRTLGDKELKTGSLGLLPKVRKGSVKAFLFCFVWFFCFCKVVEKGQGCLAYFCKHLLCGHCGWSKQNSPYLRMSRRELEGEAGQGPIGEGAVWVEVWVNCDCLSAIEMCKGV